MCGSARSARAAVVLAAVLAAPAGAAAEAAVGGKGPRIRAHGQRPISAPGPVFVRVDELAAFGDLDLAEAPPLVIRIEGDVEILQEPDGSLRIFLRDED
jgi:hypothetical protein